MKDIIKNFTDEYGNKHTFHPVLKNEKLYHNKDGNFSSIGYDCVMVYLEYGYRLFINDIEYGLIGVFEKDYDNPDDWRGKSWKAFSTVGGHMIQIDSNDDFDEDGFKRVLKIARKYGTTLYSQFKNRE